MTDGLPCPCCGFALPLDAHYRPSCPHCDASLDERISASRSDDDDDDRPELVTDGGRYDLTDEHLVCSECGAESRPGYEASSQRCPEQPSVVDDRSHDWSVYVRTPESQEEDDG